MTIPGDRDVEDGAGHELVTSYVVKRPDGQFSVMLVNRDQQNAHKVRIAFHGKDAVGFSGAVEVSTFGSVQYQWHPAKTRFMAHAESGADKTIVVTAQGSADPDGPIAHATQQAGKDSVYELPAASAVVGRGKITP